MSEPPTVETVEFYGKGNPVMEAAFAGCVRYAWSNPEIRAQFERDTGKHAPANPMDALIDQATGHDAVIAEAFVRWVAENLWGEG